MKLRIFALAAVACVTGSAFAGTADPGIDARQAMQHERIEQGVASGELTRHEASRLRTEQRGIRAEERAFKSDGRLSMNERRQLDRDLNRASRDIYRQARRASSLTSHAFWQRSPRCRSF